MVLPLPFEDGQRAVLRLESARIEAPLIRMQRFGKGGLIECWQLRAELTRIACSADTIRLVAAVGYYTGLRGPIFISTDSGFTWRSTTAPIEAWSSVASSADGTKLVAAAGDYMSSGLVCESTDSGVTWKRINAPTSPWKVVSSANGETLVGIGDGHMCVSHDSGAIWSSADCPTLKLSSVGSVFIAKGGRWTTAAISADGTQLVGAVDGGGIYRLPLPSKSAAGSVR